MSLDKNAEKKFFEETAKKLRDARPKFDPKTIDELIKTGQGLSKDPDNPY